MSIKDIMESMDYGPAPEAATDAKAWLAARGHALGHYIDGAFTGAETAAIEVENPATGEILARIPAAGEGRDRGRRGGGPRGLLRLVAASGLRAGALPLCHRPRPAEARAVLLGHRDARQRQGHPRDPHRRRAARHPPLLPPCGLGRGAGRGVSGPRAARRLRSGDPLELPDADAGVEDRAGAGGGQHGGAEARRSHAADRGGLRRDAGGDRPAQGRGQHRPWRGRDRRASRPPSGRGEGGLHRLDRRRPRDPARDGRQRQEPDARTRRQVALRGLRRCRSRCGRRRGGGGRLVQPGRGLLRGLAASAAGGDRRAIPRQAPGADGEDPRGRPARQIHRHGRHRLGAPEGPDRGADRGRGARGLPARAGGLPAARGGPFRGARLLRRHRARGHRRAGRDLRPDRGHDHLPHRRRGGGAGQQHALRACGPRSGPRISMPRPSLPRGSARAWSGSTPRTSSMRARPSAA